MGLEKEISRIEEGANEISWYGAKDWNRSKPAALLDTMHTMDGVAVSWLMAGGHGGPKNVDIRDGFRALAQNKRQAPMTSFGSQTARGGLSMTQCQLRVTTPLIDLAGLPPTTSSRFGVNIPSGRWLFAARASVLKYASQAQRRDEGVASMLPVRLALACFTSADRDP